MINKIPMPTLHLYRIENQFIRRALVLLTCIPMMLFWMAWAVLFRIGYVTFITFVYLTVDIITCAGMTVRAYSRTWRGEYPDWEIEERNP